MPGRCGPRTAGTQRKHKHGGTFAGRHSWQAGTRSSWNAIPLGSVACDVRQSRHGAGKPWWRRPGITLISVVVRTIERGKVLRARVGNVRRRDIEARVWRGTSAYRRSPRARSRYGGVWGGQGCLLRQRLWARYARWWAIDGSWGCGLACRYIQSNNFNCFLTCVLRQITVFAESMHARLARHVGPPRPLASVGVHGVSGASGNFVCPSPPLKNA